MLEMREFRRFLFRNIRTSEIVLRIHSYSTTVFGTKLIEEKGKG